MAELIGVMMVLAGLTFLLWAAGCGLHRLCAGYWPALFYALCFAWWRAGKDSALTIAAALLDADDDCTDWSRSPRFMGGLVHHDTGMEITRDFEGGISGLTVDHQSADIDSWGWYCLVTARRAWVKRKAAIIARQVNQKAAEAVQRTYGAK